MRIATRNEMPIWQSNFFEIERGRPFVPAESCLLTYKKKEPPTNLTEKPIIEWKVQPAENQKSTGKEKKRTIGLHERRTRRSELSYLVNAATTAHRTSLVLAFRHSTSGSKSRSCRTLLVAKSYCSSKRGAKAFSRTSEAWAK